MSCHSDGGQRWFDCARDPHLKIRQAQTLLPCENDQAKPDLFSRLARSTNCQRSLRTVRLSGALLDRGPGCYAQDVLELVALAEVTSYSNPRRFCANLLKISSIHHPVKPNLLPVVPHCKSRSAVEKGKPRFKSIALRKISNINQQSAPEPLRLTGDKLPGTAMAC